MPTDTHAAASPLSRRLLTFARAHDAEICAIKTSLTPHQTSRLRRTLDLMVEHVALALYRLDTPIDAGLDWHGVMMSLREQVGALLVDAASAAAAHPATPVPKPQVLIPLWPFEQSETRSGVLTACGLYAGTPLVFEVLPVEEHDLTQPVPAVSARFAAWQAATGSDVALGAVTLSGHEGAYALFASSRAS